jgi:hypothetical protein
MQPFTDLQLSQAMCLARFLACSADRIPDERWVLVRRLAVVAQADHYFRF